ncbi:transposable element Tcb2 transposase [Trichonephila clavipes]|nr:transposable element Tcb2 transposase [Trichonephila clavipes]
MGPHNNFEVEGANARVEIHKGADSQLCGRKFIVTSQLFVPMPRIVTTVTVFITWLLRKITITVTNNTNVFQLSVLISDSCRTFMYLPSNVREMDRYVTRGLMVWADITSDGRTLFHVFERGIMTAERYRVDEFLESGNIYQRDWPVRSPDIPIEHAWEALGKVIATRNTPPRTIQGLKTELLNERN